VTARIQPLRVGGEVVHQVSMPWHWGTQRSSDAGVTGDSLNDIVALTGDPNTTIEEKAFTCDVRPGRRPR
jgi:formate dehydrogenase major subunit